MRRSHQPRSSMMRSRCFFCYLLYDLPPLFRAGLAGRPEPLGALGIGLRPGRVGRAVGNPLVINEVGHRLRRPQRHQPLDFRRRPAEPRPVQQVRRRREIPTSPSALD